LTENRFLEQVWRWKLRYIEISDQNRDEGMASPFAVNSKNSVAHVSKRHHSEEAGRKHMKTPLKYI
jgi:hypothetical protein